MSDPSTPSARKRRNVLGLAVLAYLSRQPMHPYELGRMLREHGDERSIKYNQGSLYTVVGQLARAGFIAEQGTTREGSARNAPSTRSPKPAAGSCLRGFAS